MRICHLREFIIVQGSWNKEKSGTKGREPDNLSIEIYGKQNSTRTIQIRAPIKIKK